MSESIICELGLNGAWPHDGEWVDGVYERRAYKIVAAFEKGVISRFEILEGPSPHDSFHVVSAQNALNYAPQDTPYFDEGELVMTAYPPGWIGRRCNECSCAWMLPYLKQMSTGKVLTLLDIRHAYRENNEGREMPILS